MHWDDDEGTSRIVTLEVLILGEDSEGELTILDVTVAVSVSSISSYASRILQDSDTFLFIRSSVIIDPEKIDSSGLLYSKQEPGSAVVFLRVTLPEILEVRYWVGGYTK